MQRYADGKTTWPETREAILTFPYRDVVRVPLSPESTAPTPWYSGTWDEVINGYATGLLNDDEYGDLIDALEAEDTAEKERHEHAAASEQAH